jgi:hypothetical protein
VNRSIGVYLQQIHIKDHHIYWTELQIRVGVPPSEHFIGLVKSIISWACAIEPTRQNRNAIAVLSIMAP